MGGRGSGSSINNGNKDKRHWTEEKWDELTGWKLNSDIIADDSDLRRFLEAAGVVGPINVKNTVGITKYSIDEFQWREILAEQRFQRMLKSQEMQLKISIGAAVGMITFLELGTILNSWYYEKEFKQAEAYFAYQSWLENSGVNPNQLLRTQIDDWLGNKYGDWEPMITWMKENGYENFIPESRR